MVETIVLDDFSDLTLVVGVKVESKKAEGKNAKGENAKGGNAKGGNADSKKAEGKNAKTKTKDSVQRIKVSSSALRLASPVWRTMFNPSGHFLESTAKEISFPDDDPTALLIVLRIAHLRFKEVPDSLGFEEIVNVSVICDKYDTVSIVRPFLVKWAGRDMKVSPGKEQWIFVAWAFGYEDVFKSGVQKLVREVIVDDKGRSMFGRKAVNGGLPPDMMGKFPENLLYEACLKSSGYSKGRIDVC